MCGWADARINGTAGVPSDLTTNWTVRLCFRIGSKADSDLRFRIAKVSRVTFFSRIDLLAEVLVGRLAELGMIPHCVLEEKLGRLARGAVAKVVVGEKGR